MHPIPRASGRGGAQAPWQTCSPAGGVVPQVKVLEQHLPWCEEPSLPLLSVTTSALATPSARWGRDVGPSTSSAPLPSHPAVLRGILALPSSCPGSSLRIPLTRALHLNSGCSGTWFVGVEAIPVWKVDFCQCDLTPSKNCARRFRVMGPWLRLSVKADPSPSSLHRWQAGLEAQKSVGSRTGGWQT